MNESTAQQGYNLAVQQYRAGQMAEAEANCRRVLRGVPDHVGAMRLLGLLALQAGRPAESQQVLRRAVELFPRSVQLHNDLGNAFAASGQFVDAVGAFRSAWELDRQNPDIVCNLGMALLQTKAITEAVQIFSHGVAIRPNDAQIHVFLGDALRDLERFDDAAAAYTTAASIDRLNPQAHLRLGVALKAVGRTQDALAAYQRAAELSPQLAEAHFNVGNALKELKKLPEAREAYSHAIAARPNYAEALHHLATIFEQERRWDDAIVAFEQVTKLQPTLQPAFFGLGYALQSVGRLDEAIIAFRQAIALDPNSFEAVIGLTDALSKLGLDRDALESCRRALELRPDDPGTLANCAGLLDRTRNIEAAGEMYQRALQLRPDFPEAEFSRSMSLLLQGKFEEGWKGYEARWRVNKPTFDWTQLPKPLWHGEDLDGLRLLLHREQGVGDTIQFIRYVPLLVERGARVIARCESSLQRLFSQKLGLEKALGENEPLPDFDVHLPLLSVPRILGTTLDNIPGHTPYLMPPDDLIAHWRHRLASDPARLKIGLVWGGNPKHPHDRARSIPLAALAPLRSIPHVSFYSLQKGPARRQLETSRGLSVIDLAEELSDYADTAAAIMNLDLVISVDTSVAHLAGALGRPIWALHCHGSEWRWLLHRSDSPWYPTMRLFHQDKPGDWDSAVRKVERELLRGWESD